MSALQQKTADLAAILNSKRRGWVARASSYTVLMCRSFTPSSADPELQAVHNGVLGLTKCLTVSEGGSYIQLADLLLGGLVILTNW